MQRANSFKRPNMHFFWRASPSPSPTRSALDLPLFADARLPDPPAMDAIAALFRGSMSPDMATRKAGKRMPRRTASPRTKNISRQLTPSHAIRSTHTLTHAHMLNRSTASRCRHSQRRRSLAAQRFSPSA